MDVYEVNVQSMRKIGQIFVCLSESPNFNCVNDDELKQILKQIEEIQLENILIILGKIVFQNLENIL